MKRSPQYPTFSEVCAILLASQCYDILALKFVTVAYFQADRFSLSNL